MSLRANYYALRNQPEDFLHCDRKMLSHLAELSRTCVPPDATNYKYFHCLSHYHLVQLFLQHEILAHPEIYLHILHILNDFHHYLVNKICRCSGEASGRVFGRL